MFVSFPSLKIGRCGQPPLIHFMITQPPVKEQYLIKVKENKEDGC